MSLSEPVQRFGVEARDSGLYKTNWAVVERPNGHLVLATDYDCMTAQRDNLREALKHVSAAYGHNHMWSGGEPESYCIGCMVTRAALGPP